MARDGGSRGDGDSAHIRLDVDPLDILPFRDCGSDSTAVMSLIVWPATYSKKNDGSVDVNTNL